MTREETLRVLEDESPETLLANGFDDAMVGTARHFSRVLAMYDYDKCVEVLMKRDGMPYETAVEHMEYNVVGGWVGEYTPVYVTMFKG
jgi:hypothetical protein